MTDDTGTEHRDERDTRGADTEDRARTARVHEHAAAILRAGGIDAHVVSDDDDEADTDPTEQAARAAYDEFHRQAAEYARQGGQSYDFLPWATDATVRQFWTNVVRAAGLLSVPAAPPTHLQAADDLYRQHGALYKADESEYDYGYRSAYERIVDWLRHEFQPAAPAQPTVTVDPEANAAYVKLSDAAVVRTVEISGSANADYDAHAQLVGVELLGLSGAAPAQPDEAARLRSQLHDAQVTIRAFIGDDEPAAIERMARGMAEDDGWDWRSGEWNDLYTTRARAALAALRQAGGAR